VFCSVTERVWMDAHRVYVLAGVKVITLGSLARSSSFFSLG
jgi:hypothetical protein